MPLFFKNNIRHATPNWLSPYNSFKAYYPSRVFNQGVKEKVFSNSFLIKELKLKIQIRSKVNILLWEGILLCVHCHIQIVFPPTWLGFFHCVQFCIPLTSFFHQNHKFTSFLFLFSRKRWPYYVLHTLKDLIMRSIQIVWCHFKQGGMWVVLEEK